MNSATVATLFIAAMQVAAPAADVELERSVAELRRMAGTWHVTTELLDADGNPERVVEGAYRFAWVVPDRVLQGVAEQPALGGATGILYFINEGARTVEMVTVGRDGRLWHMTGPLGGDSRLSNEFAGADGGTYRLRFTHEVVSGDEVRSRMEYTGDGGESWTPGNRQRFVRRAPD